MKKKMIILGVFPSDLEMGVGFIIERKEMRGRSGRYVSWSFFLRVVESMRE